MFKWPEKFGTESLGWHTIAGVHGEHVTNYLTRIYCGRLRLHIFHRGDNDPDPHDHPWDFWTFPLTPYVEEVVTWSSSKMALAKVLGKDNEGGFTRHRQVVPAFRLTYRPATHTHRVIGRYAPYKRSDGHALIGLDVIADPNAPLDLTAVPATDDGKVITLVWLGSQRRKWGFLKNRDGQWCWIAWREYVFGGGKHTPCEPMDLE